MAVRVLPNSEWVAPSNELHGPDDAENYGVHNALDRTCVLSSIQAYAAAAANNTCGGVRVCGAVVGIVARNWRPLVATLPEITEQEHCVRDGQAVSVLAVPFDYRFPKIRWLFVILF